MEYICLGRITCAQSGKHSIKMQRWMGIIPVANWMRADLHLPVLIPVTVKDGAHNMHTHVTVQKSCFITPHIYAGLNNIALYIKASNIMSGLQIITCVLGDGKQTEEQRRR